jgi:hypothetical protein
MRSTRTMASLLLLTWILIGGETPGMLGPKATAGGWVVPRRGACWPPPLAVRIQGLLGASF